MCPIISITEFRGRFFTDLRLRLYIYIFFLYNSGMIEDSLLNAILVNEGVRPAMLVQTVDYNEALITRIVKNFPDLKHSKNYQTYQGIIISKTKDYNGRNDISLELMGDILGYPCSKEFETINKDGDTTYGITITATLTSGKEIYLFANLCKDKTKLHEFNDFATKAFSAFHDPKYKDLFQNNVVEKVNVEMVKNPSIQSILHKLTNRQHLDEDDKSAIENAMFNLGFSDDGIHEFHDIFQYNNPIHIGIAIDLLLRSVHDTLSPFYSLQNYPKEEKLVDIITQKWEKDMLDILAKTKSAVRRRRKTRSNRATL